VKSFVIISGIMIAIFYPSRTAFSQKNFKLSVYYPKEMLGRKMTVTLYNGQESSKHLYLLKGNDILITGTEYGMYTSVTVGVPPLGDFPGFKGDYLITDTPAVVAISVSKNGKDFRSSLKHTTNLSDLKQEYASFTLPEEAAISELMSRQDHLKDDVFQETNEELRKRLIRKQLLFISQHRDSYFSFQVFEHEIAPNIFADPDSIFTFYTTQFPDSWRKTPEGRSIRRTLYGKVIFRSQNITAPAFRSKDINGKPVIFTGNSDKYILLNVWATWCVPCIEELPALKEINSKYCDKVKIISISIDKSRTDLLRGIKKYGITWTNIFGDHNITNLYGGEAAIPLLYLINKDGIIIYNRLAEGDDSKLNSLNLLLRKLNDPKLVAPGKDLKD
jgi:thiol-disulfide isomerase/thioredoxin